MVADRHTVSGIMGPVNYSACAPTPLSQKTVMIEHYWPVFRQVERALLGKKTMVVVFKHRGTMLKLSEFENGGENLGQLVST